jgi:DNA-binding FadR family transcriptional regulator
VQPSFDTLPDRRRLHDRITRVLAKRLIEAADQEPIHFPKEADLCAQLGVSRTVVREAMKVLADKGMIEMKPRAGTRSTPRSRWRLLDPDILAWQAEAQPDAQFLRDLCEVRLAIEPTAAAFAAVRATDAEILEIERCLEQRRSKTGTSTIDELIELDLNFHAAIVAASHNPLLRQLCDVIRLPFRTALSCTARFPSTARLGLEAHEVLLEALRRHDPLAASRAAEEVVGLAMLAVERAARTKRTKR